MDQKLLTDFRSELLDSRFGAKAISTIAESKRFPLHEMRDDVAFQIINDELYLDGNARQNLATFFPFSYTHSRTHENGNKLLCRLLLEKKKTIADR
ncbi:glutamate decarboxylase B [Escherichia coli]|nr:glutamate decarboxylase B [Escherichia coli]